MTNSLLAEFSHVDRKMKRRRKENDKVSLHPLIFLSPWEDSAYRENEQPKRLKKNLDETWPGTAARLAQLEKRRSSQREAAGSNPGLTNNQGS